LSNILVMFDKSFFDKARIFTSMSGLLKKITTAYPLHSLLIGLYFTLYGINQYETLFIETKDVWILWGATTLLSVILFFGIKFFFSFIIKQKNTAKIAILTTTILVFILFYFHFQFNILKIDSLKFLRQHRYFLLLIMLLIGGWAFYLFKSKKTFAVLHQYLNTLVLVLLLFEVGKIAWNYHQTQQWYPAIQEEFIAYEGQNYAANDAQKPSVYHILLDAYTGMDGLKKHWDFDNAELNNYLTSKGFYVARHGQGNYFHTRQVVTATMNRDYFWNFKEAGEETAPAYLIAVTGIRNARTFKDFKAMGYELVNFSMFDVLNLPAHREYSGIPETSFLGFMLRKTVFDVYFERKRRWTHYGTAIETLDEMKAIAKRRNAPPTYVYAHLMIPHYPYYFDREGNIHEERKAKKHWSNTAFYLDQLIYTNKLIMETVDEILNSSETPPIIILHGDHGFRFLEGEAKNEAAYSVLAAFYFPKENYEQLYDSISPVNFYRATLNANFDTNFPLLKDEREKYR